MSRIVQPDEIRAGDKIRIIEEVTVSEYFGDGRFSYVEDPDQHGQGHPGIFRLAPKAEVQLIDRPLDLPVEAGSIVRIHFRRLGLGSSQTWVLFYEGGRPMWIGAKGTRMHPATFEAWIRVHHHGVEVIA